MKSRLVMRMCAGYIFLAVVFVTNINDIIMVKSVAQRLIESKGVLTRSRPRKGTSTWTCGSDEYVDY